MMRPLDVHAAWMSVWAKKHCRNMEIAAKRSLVTIVVVGDEKPGSCWPTDSIRQITSMAKMLRTSCVGLFDYGHTSASKRS